MAVRVSVLSVPLFRAHDLEVGRNWTPVTSEDNPKVIAAIRDHHGRFVQVHPDDRDKLAELGLSFVDEHSPLASTKAAGNPAGKRTTKTVGADDDGDDKTKAVGTPAGKTTATEFIRGKKD